MISRRRRPWRHHDWISVTDRYCIL
jgi:hypothetical protein